MSDFLGDLLEASQNELGTIASDGIPTSDVTGHIDTGSMIFNALVSGSLYGGIASNKITVLAGSEATGKTFFLLGTVKHFLQTIKEGRVILFESESAITKSMLVERGIDASRVAVLPVATIQEFRTQAVRILDKYIELKEKTPMLFALDSLGMLSTDKEVEDIASGSDKRDMTRAQVIRGAFRVLTLKLGKANVPMIVTNHTYDVTGAYVPTKEMSGGCLGFGTKIKMSDGRSKEIQKVQLGEYVQTLLGNKQVTQKFHFNDKEVYEIKFGDGQKIIASSEHKFLVENKWISVEDMFMLMKESSTNIIVKDIQVSNEITTFQI